MVLMTSSYRRLLLLVVAAAAGLALTAAGTGAAAAAGSVRAGAKSGPAVLAVAQVWAGSDHKGGGGSGGSGGSGSGGSGGSGGGQGQGTATPELPSGVLFGIGLLPLLAGLLVVWRRRRRVPS
jgi:hypothetical protein